jgi:hypothetical protein
MPNLEVKSYRVEHNAHNYNRIILQLTDPTHHYKNVVIYFGDEVKYNREEKVMVVNNGTITYHLPFERYAETIDLLRYEKPIYFYVGQLKGTLQNGTLDGCWITTMLEPVGEGE